MYEEDRQYALAMYSRLFDDALDEHGLLQLLVSPTRQAVVLARSYDAKERKLQVQSQSRDGLYNIDEDELPAFVMVIDDIAIQAEDMGYLRPLVDEGQMSIFDEEFPPSEAEDIRLPEEMFEAEAEAAYEQTELPEADDAGEPESFPVSADEESAAIISDLETALAEAPAGDEADAADETGVQPEDERSSVDETADAVDAFLASFSIENGELIAKAAPVQAEDEAGLPAEDSAAEEDLPAETAEPELRAMPAEEAEAVPAEAEVFTSESAAEPQSVKKLNVLLLIVYLFFAIPVGFVGVDIILIPAIVSLTLAFALVSFGLPVILSCFGSFAVIADTLMVFGIGLVLVALALFFAWLFIWFIGGAIVGFIRALINLGRKICIKEVPLQ